MIPLPSDVNWEEYFKEMSMNIAGFSGREIAKLAISWQVSCQSCTNNVSTSSNDDNVYYSF